MKRIILGTAGHIDHGKTALIQALTGVNTDRLKEEKERGISIELGFTSLDISDDIRIGVVDVPGHERFVRQMVAGAGGIDIAALVVALDEGAMPQTVEHLDILQLLGISKGLLVLTKSDLVDDELAELAQEDVKELVAGTFLEDAVMVKVSSKTGDGLEDLKKALLDLASQVEARPLHGLARLPVDRVFTLRGHGTIVTGTLISGAFKSGDDVEILPERRRSSIRSLQSHKHSQTEVFPGERVAINLRGVEQSEIHRGAMITHPNEFTPSYIIDVEFQLLKRSLLKIKHGMKVRLHHYTNDVEARIYLPGNEFLEPGNHSLVQFRTPVPLVPAVGDRVIVRALSPSITLGGGIVKNPRGEKLKGRNIETFFELEGQDSGGIVAVLIRSSGLAGISKNDLLGLSGLSATKLDKIIKALLNSREVILYDIGENRFIHGARFELLQQRTMEHITLFHKKNPLKEGIPKQELRSNIPGDDKLFRKVLEKLNTENLIVQKGDIVRAKSHKVTLDEDELKLKEDALDLIVKGGTSPPFLKDLTTHLKADPKIIKNMLNLLEKDGKLVRIKEEVYFSAEIIKEIKTKIVEFINENQGLTPSQFASITGASRKYNIPLLEYFDRERFTMRVGDQRVLRGSGNSGGGGKVE